MANYKSIFKGSQIDDAISSVPHKQNVINEDNKLEAGYIANLDTVAATPSLDNVSNDTFYDKGIESGLGQPTPEIQPTAELYIQGVDEAGIILLGTTKQETQITIPWTISTNNSQKKFKFTFTDSGVISALSRYKIVLYMTSMETNRDYEFSGMVFANINGKDILIGGNIYNNRFAITNPRIEIPLENNILPSNVTRNAGDYFEIDLNVQKSGGQPDNVNIISSSTLDSKVVRNGGEISSINIVDFDGTDTKTQSYRNRYFENKLNENYSPLILKKGVNPGEMFCNIPTPPKDYDEFDVYFKEPFLALPGTPVKISLDNGVSYRTLYFARSAQALTSKPVIVDYIQYKRIKIVNAGSSSFNIADSEAILDTRIINGKTITRYWDGRMEISGKVSAAAITTVTFEGLKFADIPIINANINKIASANVYQANVGTITVSNFQVRGLYQAIGGGSWSGAGEDVMWTAKGFYI